MYIIRNVCKYWSIPLTIKNIMFAILNNVISKNTILNFLFLLCVIFGGNDSQIQGCNRPHMRLGVMPFYLGY